MKKALSWALLLPQIPPPPSEEGVLPEKFGGGVWPPSQNPYPIYD